MKKILLYLMLVLQMQAAIPNNIIYYTSSNGQVITPYEGETEKYIAISWDGTAYTVSDEFKAVVADATTGGIATNAAEGKSIVKFGTANVEVEAVSGTTPKDVTETEYGVFPDWAEWNDVRWYWRNCSDISFGYILGTGNPVVEIGHEAVTEYGAPTGVWRPAYTYYEADGSKGMPVMGLYYKFTIKKTGLLKIGVWSNKGNRQTFIVDEATKTPIKMRAEGYINGQTDANGQKKFLSTDEIQAIHDAAKVNAEGVDSAPYVIGAGNQPFWGNLIAEVEAGKTYWLFQNSSQIGFAGYEFEPLNESEPIKSNVIYYTSSDGQVITPYKSDVFGANIVSNTYKNGKGIITIDGDVTSIGDRAFYGCTGLTSITIPESVTSIGYDAFHGCSGLTSITIPGSVTSIGNYAFNNCSGLTSITIPESVTSIVTSAFSGCSGLTSIEVESGNQYYDSRDKCNAIIRTATNSLISGCTNTIIPASVTSIGYDAFHGCSGLTSITIPESVIDIGGSAFDGCSGLTSIIVDSGNPNYDSRNDCNAIIKTSTNSLLWGCQNTIIPKSVTNIGSYAFSQCSGLTSITIPKSVTRIGIQAFSGCSGLTSITIPESVTSIGTSAFSGCSGLTSITIPESVTSIGTSAFYGCSSLTSITIPESVTSIESETFRGCSGLTSITIPESVNSIGTSAFSG